MPINRKPYESAVLTFVFWFFGYLYWGRLQALAVFLACAAGTLLFGLLFFGLNFGFFLGWGKWILWAALAAYNWRADERRKMLEKIASRAQKTANMGRLAESLKIALQRETNQHFAKTTFWEFGFCYFCALAFGALLSFDGNSAIVHAFLSSTLWNQLVMAGSVLGGLALIGTVALFGWVSLTAALERVFTKRITAIIQLDRKG